MAKYTQKNPSQDLSGRRLSLVLFRDSPHNRTVDIHENDNKIISEVGGKTSKAWKQQKSASEGSYIGRRNPSLIRNQSLRSTENDVENYMENLPENGDEHKETVEIQEISVPKPDKTSNRKSIASQVSLDKTNETISLLQEKCNVQTVTLDTIQKLTNVIHSQCAEIEKLKGEKNILEETVKTLKEEISAGEREKKTTGTNTTHIEVQTEDRDPNAVGTNKSSKEEFDHETRMNELAVKMEMIQTELEKLKTEPTKCRLQQHHTYQSVIEQENNCNENGPATNVKGQPESATNTETEERICHEYKAITNSIASLKRHMSCVNSKLSPINAESDNQRQDGIMDEQSSAGSDVGPQNIRIIQTSNNKTNPSKDHDSKKTKTLVSLHSTNNQSNGPFNAELDHKKFKQVTVDIDFGSSLSDQQEDSDQFSSSDTPLKTVVPSIFDQLSNTETNHALMDHREENVVEDQLEISTRRQSMPAINDVVAMRERPNEETQTESRLYSIGEMCRQGVLYRRPENIQVRYIRCATWSNASSFELADGGQIS